MAKLPEFPFEFDFEKLFREFRIPGVDVEAMVASQRRNLDALTQANRLALEGVQALYKRQIEIMRQTVEESASAARSLAEAGTPQETAARQTQQMKEGFERALANARELSEIVSKSNSEAFDLLNKRFSAILDEIRETIAKQK